MDYRFESYENPPDPSNELVQGLFRDCQITDPILFEVTPVQAYMILAMMQTSIVKLEIKNIESISKFGKEFIYTFCDRYKEKLPNICKSLELGWLDEYQMTEEEFDKFWRSNATT